MISSKKAQKMLGLMSVLLAALILLPELSVAEVKIGYIDMQKAIQQTNAGKKAKKSLKKAFDKRKKELGKKEADLKKMSGDLEKKAMVLSDDVRLKKQQELQREMLKYREMVTKSQLEFQKKEQDLTKPIIKKLQKILGKIAKKEDYSVVLEKSEQSVMWAKADLDLTARVIKEFNK